MEAKKIQKAYSLLERVKERIKEKGKTKKTAIQEDDEKCR
jgi:hypothetical protein